ncbi:MAG: 4-hydroxy-3-methylbut-2-enyl diphosphate reductase [Clostridiales bacterium]|jgi:4-hydroxy-3-methylbut-2-enyl diphosphate reductase|nr:4-hydroxy-3-methylbut-2-enyl diphosphate reductase [Clostridiales bacterium]
MKCYIPKYSGFCFGVALAVEAAYDHIGNSTFMFGEVVHNPAVISDLAGKGLGLINSLDEIPKGEKANVLIRAHGVSADTINEIQNRSLGIIDKTCPRVKKVHDIVADASGRGLDIVIVGTPNHPEVLGIAGWAGTRTVVVRDANDAEKIIPDRLFPNKGICLVAQTTQNEKKYEEVYRYCSGIFPYIEFNDTICDAAAVRQEEIRQLAKIVDCVIVIGGKASSNVTRLFEIASEYNSNTQHIESFAELDMTKIIDVKACLIASGTSTPEKSISQVVDHLKLFCLGNGKGFELIRGKT